MSLFEYSPDNVSISFNGINIVGFQNGTFIEVDRNEDGFTAHAGSLGDVARSKNLNRMAKITLTLMMGSSSNDALAAIAAADEAIGAGVGAFQITDATSPALLVHADQAWIMKQPKVERGKEAGAVVWVFECAACEIFVGGYVG